MDEISSVQAGSREAMNRLIEELWKGIRVIIQIRLMPYSIYVIWMLIMLYHKVTCCIRSLKIVFGIIPFRYCVPKLFLSLR